MPNKIEKAASEAMGVIKDVKAGLKGLTGVFRHLMEEHGKVTALIKRVSMSSDESVRANLFPTIRSELIGHEEGELKAVYPVLAEYPETSAIAEEQATNTMIEMGTRMASLVTFANRGVFTIGFSFRK